MFISNDEKNLINLRLKNLDESVNDHAFKLQAIEKALGSILNHLDAKAPAKKRGRPPGVKNKSKRVSLSPGQVTAAKKAGVALEEYAKVVAKKKVKK